MKQLFVQSWSRGPYGDYTFACTEHQGSASVYSGLQASIDRDFLSGISPTRIAHEGTGERLFFEDFRVLQVDEALFCIAFESRTEAERIIFCSVARSAGAYQLINL